MDYDPNMSEPTALADAMAPLRHRLAERGLNAEMAAPATPARETAEEAQERRAARAGVYRDRWRASVPTMYQDASLDDLDESQGAVRVRSWLQSGSLHLVLAGPVGTGKTHAAYAVGNQALAAGRGAEAYAVGDLLDALRPGSSDRDAERRARDAPVLILDDLAAKATDWETERLTLLLDARVRAMRQTVVTTNITSDQITATWGDRLMDRLRLRLTVVTMTGPSRRTGTW